MEAAELSGESPEKVRGRIAHLEDRAEWLGNDEKTAKCRTAPGAASSKVTLSGCARQALSFGVVQ